MLDFIISDSKENYLIYKNLIDKFMMKFDIEYTVNKYSETILKKQSFKIYILNVSTLKDSGLDIGLTIRRKLNDWQSMLIFTSDYPNLEIELLKLKLMYIDFITDKKEKRLEKALDIALKNYETRPKVITFNYKTNYYQIPLSEIIYIEKELDTKRCLLKTENKTIIIPGNLTGVSNKLDSRFFKSSRSYIINLEKVIKYDTKTNLIEFLNGEILNIVSREKKKELTNYFRTNI